MHAAGAFGFCVLGEKKKQPELNVKNLCVISSNNEDLRNFYGYELRLHILNFRYRTTFDAARSAVTRHRNARLPAQLVYVHEETSKVTVWHVKGALILANH